MYKYFSEKINNKKGFTVIELLICVSILGILTAVAVPIIDKKQKKSKMNECKMNCQCVTTIVREIMTGMVDNGKKQEYIPVLCELVEGRHKVYKFDSEGNPITDWHGDQVFYYENHIDGNNDNICDVCEAPIKTSKYWTSKNHIPQSHLVFKDADGNDLTVEGDSGVEVAEDNVSAIETYTAFLKLDVATVGDIRGGYRYAEITKKYTSEDGNLEQYIVTAKQSDKPAINNPNYKCKDYTYNLGAADGYYLKKLNLYHTLVSTYLGNSELPVCPFDKNGSKGYFYYIDGTGTCHCSCPNCQ